LKAAYPPFDAFNRPRADDLTDNRAFWARFFSDPSHGCNVAAPTRHSRCGARWGHLGRGCQQVPATPRAPLQPPL